MSEALARLVEMDQALAALQRELPDDMRPLGERARAVVAQWLNRLAAGEVDASELSAAMEQVSGMMDALTTRLLLQPWETTQKPPRA